MLKESRKIEPIMILKIGRTVCSTHYKATDALAGIVIDSLWCKMQARYKGTDRRYGNYWTLKQRAARRIAPHCKWFYLRK